MYKKRFKLHYFHHLIHISILCFAYLRSFCFHIFKGKESLPSSCSSLATSTLHFLLIFFSRLRKCPSITAEENLLLYMANEFFTWHIFTVVVLAIGFTAAVSDTAVVFKAFSHYKFQTPSLIFASHFLLSVALRCVASFPLGALIFSS